MRLSNQIETLVNDAFKQMSASKNPYFWSIIQTTDGQKRAMTEIVQYAITNRLSVGAAIAQLESTYAE